MNYFFVFQSKTLHEEERKGGFLWAPQYMENGKTPHHWNTMKEIKKGDAIIHSVDKHIVSISIAKTNCYESPRPNMQFNDWEKEGWRVDVEYHNFNGKMITSNYMDKLKEIQPRKYAPFNILGRGNTGYLFMANKEMFEYIVRSTAEIQETFDEKRKVLQLLEDFEIKKLNLIADEELNEELSEEFNNINNDVLKNFSYSGKVKEKTDPVLINNVVIQRRDKKTAFNALAYARFLCEVDSEHPTFIRKNRNVNYTEPHHLVPLAFSDKFDVSLDVEENILSLCSNCHNQLHYGKDYEKLLEKLYNKRKSHLELVGIHITLKELIDMYR